MPFLVEHGLLISQGLHPVNWVIFFAAPAVEHCDAGEGKLYQGKYSWPNMIADEENCGDAISDWEEGLYHGATHLSGNSEQNICGQLPPIFKDNAMPWFNETTLEHEQTCIFGKILKLKEGSFQNSCTGD